MDYVAELPTCGLLLTSSPIMKRSGTPQTARGYVVNEPICSPPLSLLFIVEALGGKGYVTILPTCGPLQNWSLCVKH